ncbi:MAG: hypothetical protein K2Y27_05620 [Xanthobacteraceae bacterium]|nr:hypothetical protein [Xanthobacteraceae bacterium]
MQRRSQRFESVTEMLTAAKTISGAPPRESPYLRAAEGSNRDPRGRRATNKCSRWPLALLASANACMDTAMTRTLVLALLLATLANALCLVGRF